MLLSEFFLELLTRILTQNLLSEPEEYIAFTFFLDKTLPDALERNAPTVLPIYRNYLNRIFKSMINQLFYTGLKFIEIENQDYNNDFFSNLLQLLAAKNISPASRFIAVYFYQHRSNFDISMLFEHVFLAQHDGTTFSDFCALCHDLNLVDAILYLSLPPPLTFSSEHGLRPILRKLKSYPTGKLKSFLINYIIFVKMCFDTANLPHMIAIFTMNMGLLKETLHTMLLTDIEDDDRTHLTRGMTYLIKRISFLDDNIQTFMSVEFHEYFIFFEQVFGYLNKFRNRHGLFLDLIAIGTLTLLLFSPLSSHKNGQHQ